MQYSKKTATVATSLRFQHYLFFREIGSLIPETVPLTEIKQVLDVCCGPGAWCIEMASLYPDMQIVGVDIDADLIRIAQQDVVQARESLPIFECCTSLEKLPYASNRFDFIHLYHSNAGTTPQIRPALLLELWRILRPGGWINLVELEIGPVSSAAADTLFSHLRQVASNDIGELRLTSAVLYPQLLAQAGYRDIQYSLYPVDLGNQKGHMGRDYVMSVLANDRQIASFLDRMGVATREEVEVLLRNMIQDAQQIDYFCAGMLISAIGVKPFLTSGDTPVLG
ncbi:MAG TPA: methyltransferase domain-containing protein [Ktedonosporobacter sp.]|nr:methyltransferase domain-containing protein [Ktedonosporobacter sp.]